MKQLIPVVLAALLLAGCGSSSSSTSSASEAHPPPHDGPQPTANISTSALGDEELEQGELEAQIKLALEEGDGQPRRWTVTCNGSPGKGRWICTYFSRELVAQEAAAGRGEHVILSVWVINQNTGKITELSQEEVEGSEY